MFPCGTLVDVCPARPLWVRQKTQFLAVERAANPYPERDLTKCKSHG
jgi:hypothetical protein